MSDDLVAADLDSYRLASQRMAAAQTDAPRCRVPNLGHAGAEAAMDHFAGSLASYHARLNQATADGATSINRLLANFNMAGNDR